MVDSYILGWKFQVFRFSWSSGCRYWSLICRSRGIVNSEEVIRRLIANMAMWNTSIILSWICKIWTDNYNVNNTNILLPINESKSMSVVFRHILFRWNTSDTSPCFLLTAVMLMVSRTCTSELTTPVHGNLSRNTWTWDGTHPDSGMSSSGFFIAMPLLDSTFHVYGNCKTKIALYYKIGKIEQWFLFLEIDQNFNKPKNLLTTHSVN